MSKRVLCLGDMHAPFTREGWLDFAKKIYKEYKCDYVVQIGDLLDQYAFTRYVRDPDAYGAKYEIEKAKETIRDMYKAFPKGFVILGNHDTRLAKRAAETGIPKWLLRSYAELVELPSNWDLGEEVEIDDVKYFHGEGLSANTELAVRKVGQSVVYGHCFKETAKVMVKGKGYVPILDVSVGDTVYGYDPKLQRAVETKVVDTTKFNYSGKMIKHNHKYFTQDVTENHHLFTKDGRYIQCTDTSLNLSDVIFSNHVIGVDREITNPLLSLQIAIAADGSIENTDLLRFHLSKERKVSRLESILNKLDISYTKNVQSDGTVKINFKSSIKKELPKGIVDASREERLYFIEEVIHWDGTINTGLQFNSHKPEEIELVSQVLTSLGIIHGIRSSGTGIQFKLNSTYFGGTGRSSDKPLREVQSTYEVENLVVGCITTELSNFYVLTEEGRVELTGNTHKGSIAFKAMKKDLLFAMNCGCLIDQHAYAFEYAKHALEKSFIGVGVIIDGKQPILIPMPLKDYVEEIKPAPKKKGRPKKKG